MGLMGSWFKDSFLVFLSHRWHTATGSFVVIQPLTIRGSVSVVQLSRLTTRSVEVAGAYVRMIRSERGMRWRV